MTINLLRSFLFLVLACSFTNAGWPEDEVDYWDDIIIKKAGISTTPNNTKRWLESRIPNSINGQNVAKWVAD